MPVSSASTSTPRPRARDLGIAVGTLPTGPFNAITDVAGVRVGHTTLIEGEGPLVPGVGPVRTGATAILPHEGDVFLEKVTAAIVRINGFGEVTNSEQVYEMGMLEGPILLTNTLNVPRVADAVIEWTLESHPQIGVTTYGISPIVAETWDGYLNDIRGRHVRKEHVYHAIQSAASGAVEEGAIGSGTGMICYEFKGGIGTASRRVAEARVEYTVGVLLQSNFGSRTQLLVDGVPVGRELADYPAVKRPSDGSVIVVIATDAPMTHRQLTRLGRRATHGLARTGSISGNTSGDFAIAFSTARRRPHHSETPTLTLPQVIEEGPLINLLFTAVVEATEEAVLNSIFRATTTTGRDDHVVYALPIDETLAVMRKYGRPV